MAGTTTKSTPTQRHGAGSDMSDLLLNFNRLVDDVAALAVAGNADGNVTAVTPTVGTTNTIAVPASVIQINGTPVIVTALTAQAFGALGTIPANSFGIINLERVAAGTCTFVSGAANYSTGYATAALALAAKPAQSADKVIVGYVIVGTDADAWIAGTDGLADGSGGTPAATTVYGAGIGLYTAELFTAAKIGNRAGTAITV